MTRTIAAGFAVLLAASAAGEALAQATVPGAGGQRFQVNLRSYAELKFREVVPQAFDLSCGAAAMATLLRFFYGEELNEPMVIEGIFEFGDEEKIEQSGFSMLELKRYGEERGYVAGGFRIPDVENLRNLKVPVITLINTRGYNHFVVLKDVVGDKVYIADPAFGNRVTPLSTFSEEWNNVVLVFVSEERGGDADFLADKTLNARTQDLVHLVNPVLNNIRPQPGEF